MAGARRCTTPAARSAGAGRATAAPGRLARAHSRPASHAPRGICPRIISSYFLSMAAVMSAHGGVATGQRDAHSSLLPGRHPISPPRPAFAARAAQLGTAPEAMKPGAMELQVMPRPANSRATVLVMAITPAPQRRRGHVQARGVPHAVGQCWNAGGKVCPAGCCSEEAVTSPAAAVQLRAAERRASALRTSLGGRVVGLAGVAHQAHHRGDVDDAALALLCHELGGGLQGRHARGAGVACAARHSVATCSLPNWRRQPRPPSTAPTWVQ